MDISKRVSALKEEMKKEAIDIYIVPSSDYHQSEYVGEYFKARRFITGFTGSAGTALFSREKSGLWTDGRYFIQAEQELRGSGISLYRMGEPDVDTIEEFLKKMLPRGGTAGFDGRTVGLAEGRRYEKAASSKGGSVRFDLDLIGRIWQDRPELPKEKAFFLEEKYAGESTASKLKKVRAAMEEKGAGVHLLSSLDDIAWLFNFRGNDISYCPLVLAHALIFMDHVTLFADPDKFAGRLKEELEKNRITVRPYEEAADALGSLKGKTAVLLDPARVNYMFYQTIPEDCRIIEDQNPEVLLKSMKNDTEARNMRTAHRKDAVAQIRFLRWLKSSIGKEHITEISAAEKLEAFRMEQEGYVEPSFNPICAFGEHGAIVHYSATEESCAEIRPGRLLLMDTGGHYLEGTTDITRTIVLGDVSDREKEDFTLVLRAMLRLMNMVFLHGCSGANLDCIAREEFWKTRVNFNHGTGHGVGYLLSVHEAPVNFRWKETGVPAPALEKNMVISDEPGIYLEGSHGIRLENLLIVCEDIKNEYGQFMRFEPLTLVPVDLDGVLPERMSEEERGMLNSYHRMVYEEISPFLDDGDRDWLKEATRPV